MAAPGAVRAVEVPRIPGTATIDGRVGAEEWGGIPLRSLAHEIEPQRVVATPWRTAVQVAHDGRRLLVAVEASDEFPDRIVAPRGARDSIQNNEDYVVVMVDAEGNRQRHFEFRVNPSGVLADTIIAGTGSGSPQWSGAWDAAARRTDRGYVVEFAIPLSTLNARPDAAGGISLSINVARRVGRDRRELLSMQPVDLRELCAECQYEMATLSGATPESQSLQLRPYLSVRRVTVHPAGTPSDHKTEAEPGLDVLWQMGNGKKLVGTLNPDFSEVAPDQIQFDVNRRYAVVFNENRPFFTENAGLFGAPLQLVYTRSIADPAAALAWSATGPRQSLAVLYARDRATSFVVPGSGGSSVVALPGESHALLARAQRNGAEGRRFGSLITARDGEDYSNLVVSLDGRQVFGSYQSLEGAVAVSDARAGDEIAARHGLARHSNGYMARLSHQYKRGNLTVTTTSNRATPDFRPDSGNINRVGITNIFHEWSLNQPRPAGGRITRYGLSAWVNHVNQLHEPDGESNLELFAWMNLSDGSGADGRLRLQRETFGGRDYDLFQSNVGYGWQITPQARLFGGLGYDRIVDVFALETAHSLSPFLDFNVKVGTTLTVSGGASLDVTEGRTVRDFSTRSATLRANWSPRLGHTVSLVSNWGATRENRHVPDLPEFRSDRLRGQVVYLYQRADRSAFHVGFNVGGAGSDGLGSVRRTDELLFGKVVINMDWMK